MSAPYADLEAAAGGGAGDDDAEAKFELGLAEHDEAASASGSDEEVATDDRLVREAHEGGAHLGSRVSLFNGLRETGVWWQRAAKYAVALGAFLIVLAVAVGVPAERADEDDSEGEAESHEKKFSFFAFGMGVIYLLAGALSYIAIALESGTFEQMDRAAEQVRTSSVLRWDCSEDSPEQWGRFVAGARGDPELGVVRRSYRTYMAVLGVCSAAGVAFVWLAAGWATALGTALFVSAPVVLFCRAWLRRRDHITAMELRPGRWGLAFHSNGTSFWHNGSLYWSSVPFASVRGCSFVYGDEENYHYSFVTLDRREELGGWTMSVFVASGRRLLLLPVPDHMHDRVAAFLRSASLLREEAAE